MNKNIYEMLNDSEINLDTYTIETVNDIEKANMKKRFKASIKKNRSSRKNKIAVAALAITLSASILVATFDESVLATINIIGTDISTKLGINKKLDEYKTVVNKSVTDKGITIQLNEVILDGNTLIVSTTIKSQNVIDVSGIHPFGNIKINGKKVNAGAGGSSKKIDDYTEEEIMEYTPLDVNTEGNLDVEINYKDALVKGKTLKGNWNFAFKTNGEELAANTQNIPLNHKIVLENGVEINLYNYRTNDLGQKIFYTKTKAKSEKNYHLMLKGTDNLGNPVEFGLRFESSDKGELCIEKLHSHLSEEATELTLTPYAVELPEKSGEMNSNFVKIGEEFKINLAK